jgi:hypothetical protein
MSLASIRAQVAAYLDGDFYNVLPYPPAQPLANTIAVVPDDPYYQMGSLGLNGLTIRFKLTLWVKALDNQGNLAELENLIEEVLLKLPPGIKVTQASQPSLLTMDNGTNLITTDLSIEVSTILGD